MGAMPGFAWFLLVLGAAVGLLCIPVGLRAAYRTGEPPRLELCWLWLRVDLVGLAQRQAAAPQKGKAKSPGKKRTKAPRPPKTAEEFCGQLELLRDLLGAARAGAALLLRHLKVTRLRLHLAVAGEDAAQTAIRYGQVNGAVYSLYTLARRLVRMVPPDISIRPDFLAEAFWMDLELRLRLRPLWALAAAVYTAGNFLTRALRRKQAPPPVKPAEPMEKQAG